MEKDSESIPNVQMARDRDLEKCDSSISGRQGNSSQIPENDPKIVTSIFKRLAGWGVELRGIQPVPVEERTKDNYANMFYHWCTMLLNVLP